MNFDGYSRLDFGWPELGGGATDHGSGHGSDQAAEIVHGIGVDHGTAGSRPYRLFKSATDLTLALLALPLIATVALLLLVLNPVFNPGPLFFTQERMGRHGTRFRMWKFRSMLPADEEARAHDAALELHRITPLGHLLRRSRLDELPNFFNVLRGEMSVIGPRPDAWSHALAHMGTVPSYRARFRVRPGITGLAQVRAGYADCARSTRRKARLDRHYVTRAGLAVDLYVLRRTLFVMLTGFGAK